MSRTLLELSRAHAIGQLDTSAYRAQRRLLIRQQLQNADDVTQPVGLEPSVAPAGEVTRDLTREQPRQPPDEVTREDTQENTRDNTRDFTPSTAYALHRSAPSRARGAWLVGAVLSGVLGVAAALWLPGDGDTEPAEVPASNSIVVASPLAGALAELQAQGEPSLNELERYLEQWNRSASAERRAVAASHDHRRLVTQLESRIRVEEALDPHGEDARVSARIRQLQALLRGLSG